MQSIIRPRILYADADEVTGLVLSILVELSDIEVQTAKTVDYSLQLARTGRFNLYLLDTRFPEGNGLELCRRLREFDPYTPIIFYSADGRAQDKSKGLAAGANVYLVKPDWDNVISTILRLIKPTTN